MRASARNSTEAWLDTDRRWTTPSKARRRSISHRAWQQVKSSKLSAEGRRPSGSVKTGPNAEVRSEASQTLKAERGIGRNGWCRLLPCDTNRTTRSAKSSQSVRGFAPKGSWQDKWSGADSYRPRFVKSGDSRKETHDEADPPFRRRIAGHLPHHGQGRWKRGSPLDIEKCPAPDDKWPNAAHPGERSSPGQTPRGLVGHRTEGTAIPGRPRKAKVGDQLSGLVWQAGLRPPRRKRTSDVTKRPWR